MDSRDTGWEGSRCANANCSGGTMWVSRSQRQADLWFVTVAFDRRRYVEVAQTPFCPLCSQELVPATQPALPLAPATSTGGACGPARRHRTRHAARGLEDDLDVALPPHSADPG